MKKIILSLFIITLLLAAGCTQPPVKPGKTVLAPGTYTEISLDIDEPVTTSSFKSVTEYAEFIKSYEGGSGYYGRGGMMLSDVGEDMMVMETSAPMAKGAPAMDMAGSSNEFSETNIQVAGVDEADMLKTDGNYIYTISNDILYIIKAYPGEDAEIVATLPYEEDDPQSIFIDGDRMAVFGDFQNLDFYKDMDFRPTQGMTFFDIYDISDKSNPKLLKEYRFEGRYFNGRMIDDYVYFVVRTGVEYRPVFPTPIIFEDGVRSSMPVTDIHYFNIPYDNPQFITVHSIDINNIAAAVDSTGVAVEYGQNLYMSQDNMYITYTQRINEYDIEKEITMSVLEPLLSQEDKKLIAKIKLTDNDILNQNEKENKIYQIYMSYANYMTGDERDDLEDEVDVLLMEKLEEIEHFEYTVINKIKVNEGKVSVTDNGKVPGRIINQFSMDEEGDNFRIATTISGRWSRFEKTRTDSTNNVYVLDKSLKIVGELEGLAETEQIYSTRFIGDRLYMVTFRQVDPFFVIDLSNPENPKELGKLKIPGFSRYLHPYDKDTIIGIGQDATETGRTRGLKVSLFDVSDVENPKEVAKFVTDEKYAQSTALTEHKAFLFDKEKELMVIPAYSYEYNRDGGSAGYNGAFVFKINKDAIELRGLIDHSMAEGDSGHYRYRAQVERSLWINELLYTKSPTLLRINELEDLSSVKNLDLVEVNTKIPIY